MTSCSCRAAPERFLLLSRRPDVRLLSLDTPDLTDVVLPLRETRHTAALDYDPVDGFVYWTDKDLRVIRRAKLDGTGTAALGYVCSA